MLPAGFRYIMFQQIRSYYLTAVADLRFQGLEVLIYRIIVKLCSPVARLDLQVLFDYDLSGPVPWRRPLVDVVITQASSADVDEILEMQMPVLTAEEEARLRDLEELQYAQMLRARAKAWDTYQRQLLAGEWCFIARVQGVLVHSNWLRFHDCGQVEGCPVALQPGEVYSTDGFTRESHRGLRLHEAVATYQLEVARQRGCVIAYTITDMTKGGSRRGVKRIGWRRRGTVLYATPRGLHRTWLFRLGGDIEPMFDQARTTMAAEP